MVTAELLILTLCSRAVVRRCPVVAVGDTCAPRNCACHGYAQVLEHGSNAPGQQECEHGAFLREGGVDAGNEPVLHSVGIVCHRCYSVPLDYFGIHWEGNADV